MKQRITVEQLMELTEEQKQRLRELTESKVQDGDYVVHNGMKTLVDDAEELKALMNCYKNKFKECYILLNIGQIIELLTEKEGYPNIYISNYPGVKTWGLTYICNPNIEIETEPTELCDALWQAVKEVL
jgi:hypothetical protein